MKDSVQAANRAEGPRWMIVDDNPEMLTMMREVASLVTDAPIDCCGTPDAALAAFDLEPREYGFVIMDFELPGMNGAELCRRLREASPKLKVLLATSSPKMKREEISRNGFCGWLDKPFGLSSLENALAEAGVYALWRKSSARVIRP